MSNPGYPSAGSERDILNAYLLSSKFGFWPSFHDAEIISAHLDRDGCVLRLRIYTFGRTEEVIDGHYRTVNRCIVTLAFAGIRELDMGGFNEQNVLNYLQINKKHNGLHVELFPLYGLGGTFDCDAAEVVEVETLE